MIAFALLALAHSQDDDLPPVTYPAIAATARDAAGFVPAGWSLEQQQSGDLNGDGLPDLALAFHQQDSANILPNEGGFCGESTDTNPRILAVALAVPGGGYRLAVQNHDLVPRYDDACADDWFSPEGQSGGGIAIARGAIRVTLGRFRSAGGWSMGSSVFTFRWQGGALRLIGFDYTNIQRNSGETQSLSIDYLSRRVRTAFGTIDNDRERVRWSRLPPAPLPTIDQIGDGMAFDPGKRIEQLSLSPPGG
jgi:hypothetical protein